MDAPTAKAAKLAASMLREYAADGVKAAAVPLLCGAFFRAMREKPADMKPSLEAAQALCNSAAMDLEAIARAGL